MTCFCGCGRGTSQGRRFVLGHHTRVLHPMKGKHFSVESRKKMSIARKGKSWEEFYGSKEKAVMVRNKLKKTLSIHHPMQGRHHTEQARKLISQKNTGNIWSEEQKIRFSRLMKGRLSGSKNGMYGKPSTMKGKTHTKEAREKISLALKGKFLGVNNPNYGKYWTKEQKEHLSRLFKENKYFSGSNNPMYGKQCPKIPFIKYNGIRYRSTWEANYVKWLEMKGYHFKYEPQRFYSEDGSYLPDFWVDELNSYVEIKGFLGRDKDNGKRMFMFVTKYPLILIQSQEYNLIISDLKEKGVELC